jgi:hypothetical protein
MHKVGAVCSRSVQLSVVWRTDLEVSPYTIDLDRRVGAHHTVEHTPVPGPQTDFAQRLAEINNNDGALSQCGFLSDKK